MTCLSVENLGVGLNGRTILDGIDAKISAGEMVGLIGPNGAGKTTLLRAMAALLPVDKGHIVLNSRPLNIWKRRDLARIMAYVPQGAPCAWPLDVYRLVALGRLPHLLPWRSATPVDENAIQAALEQTDVVELANRNVLTLSGGERARVMMARALAAHPSILLADEPIASLDPQHQLRVMTVLRRLAADGVAVIVTLHDLNFAARFCDRLILLADGHVVTEGNPSSVLTPEIMGSVFAVRAELGWRNGRFFVVPWEVLDAHDDEGQSGGRHATAG